MWRCGPAGEPRGRGIESAPEKMHRAGLTDEAAAEPLEHRHYPGEREPEPLRLLRVVRRVLIVLGEGNRVRDLHRHRPHWSAQAEGVELAHELAVESGHRSGLQRDR